MKKFFVTFFSLLCVLACAVGLAACGGSTEGGKPHEHVFSSQWSHNETHHWHAATCEHTDEVKDKAEHDFANGECVCGYKLPDKTSALISFFEKNFADKVFGDKTVYAQTAYADEENDALKGITVVYTYEITEVFRAVELAQLSFEPIAVADIISGSAAAPQSELTRTTVFEFDAKDNYNRQDVADAIYAVYKKTSDIKLFNQSESGQRDLTRLQILEEKDNKYTIYQMDVLEGETDEALIFNIHTPEVVFNKKTISSTTIVGTIFYEKNYSYEKLDQVKIRYNAIKENNETVGFKLSEIYDKTVTSLEIPAEYYGKPVTELAEGAFDGCDALQSITVDENNSAYASADGILYNKEKTQILAVPQAITGKVTLADGVTELAANTFADCTALTEIVLPNGLQTIGDNAFKGCSFTEVSLPESVTQVYGAFTDCNALEKLSLPACGNILGYYFGTDSYSQQKDNIPNSLKTVIIRGGDTVTDYAFYGCGLLESVIIPDSVTTIGERAFVSCSALESVTVPDSVTTMGSYVFSGCDFTLVLCKAPSAPSGWNADFARGALAVIYDCDNNDTDADGAMYTVQNGLAYKIKDNAASVVAARIAADGIAVVPESITHKNVAYTVTSIGTVFKDNKQLKELTLGSGITNLANNAFERCERLEHITVSAENPSYVSVDGILYNKAKTEIIHIPRAIKGAISVLNGVRTVDVAWRYNITSINIPDSATNVLPMEGCNSLERITVSAGNKQYTSVDGILCFKQSYNIYHVPQAMKGAVTLPVGAQAIGNSMFANRGAITSIIIPDTVTSIGTYAFDGCSSLTSIIIPNSVTSIGQHAFDGCSRLTSVTLSNSLTSIGDYMFRNCKSLTSIIIPESITRIGEAAFRSCSSLTSITIPESVKFIGQVAFDGCSSLTSIIIPDSVTSIGDGAFSGCSSLTSITIPDSVTSIGDNMFSGCSSLTSITIPDGVTTIGIYAFRSCSSLTSIIIPDSVTRIGEAAFADCSSLTSITFNGTKAQWNAISKDNYWNYNTGNYTIHCTDGDIAKAN